MRGQITHTLFVALPNRTTHSMRRLSRTVHVKELKSRLELEVGIPSHVYVVFFGETHLQEDDVIEFQGGVKNGAVIRLVLKDEWKELYAAVVTEDTDAVKRICLSDSSLHESGSKKVHYADVDNERAAVALFISAYNGYHYTVRQLVESSGAPLVSQAVSAHGRCSVHAGAAGDQVQVLEMLLQCGAPANSTDRSGQTPTDVASGHGAYIAERFLRNHVLRRRGIRQALSTVGQATQRPSSARPTPSSILTSPRTLPFKSSSQSHTNNKKTTFETIQVQENVEGTTTATVIDKQIPESTAKKRKARIKSAPVKMQSNSVDSGSTHDHCSSRPPFMAFRTVPFEELRPIAVEYVPLSSGRYLGQDQRTQERHVLSQMAIANRPEGRGDIVVPTAPCSSLNNSLEDLSLQENGQQSVDKGQQSAEKSSAGSTTSSSHQIPHNQVAKPPTVYQWKLPNNQSDLAFDKTVTWMDKNAVPKDNKENEKKAVTREDLIKEYTKPAGTRTLRAQSARYYRTRYHLKAEEDKYYETIPRPRPSTAGPRYRAWKTWLIQKYEEDTLKENQQQQNAPRKERSTRAFKRWLARKYKELDEQSDSESDDYSDNEEENNKAFDKWLESKRPYFLQKQKSGGGSVTGRDSRLSVYQIGSTDDTKVRHVDYDSYMKSQQRWRTKKSRYESWKDRKGMAKEDDSKWSKEELSEMRRHMVLEGYTYEEWMGQKQRERKAAKLNVTAFGEQSPRRW